MPTLVATWAFPSDAMGLVDEGVSGALTFAYDGSDGSPATGCVKFTGTVPLGGDSERARRSSTGQTWQTLGVPAGVNVTSVQATATKYKTASNPGGLSMKVRIVDSSGNSVHGATDLVSIGVAGAVGWTAASGGQLSAAQSVTAGKQASTTDIRLELDVTCGVSGSLDARFDSIDITITYTSPPPSSFTLTPASLSTRPGVLTGLLTITLDNPAGAGGEVFALTDAGRSGTFYPSASVTVPSGATTVTFSYLQPVAGSYTLTATAQTTTAMGAHSAALLVTTELPGFDVRLYDATGKRKHFPRSIEGEGVVRVNCEILARGGFGRGDFETVSVWENSDLSGNERVDVWFNNALYWRGYVRIPERSISSSGETARPTLYGRMELLNKYLSRQRYAYSSPVDLSQVFTDIVNDDLRISGRLASVVIDAQTIGVTIQQFDQWDRTLREALDALCDIAPGQCIWGFDVDGSGNDRIYIRPQPTTIVYRMNVRDGDTDSFVQSKDYTTISNRLRILGGRVAQPNLIQNGSFEHPLPNSEVVGNLLIDYSLELNDAAWSTSTGTRKQSGVDFGGVRTGSWWYELDTNGEKLEQVVSIDYRVPYTGSFWARREDNAIARQVRLVMEGLNASNTVISTVTMAYTDPGSSTYKRYTLDADFSAFSTVTKIRYRIETNGGAASNDGVDVDDCALYEKYGVSNSGWKWSVAGAAKRAQMSWQVKSLPSVDTRPYHGGYCMMAQASGVAISSDYLEIRTETTARIKVKAQGVYTFLFFIRTDLLASNMSFTFGLQEYKGDGTTNGSAQESGTQTGNSVAWTKYSLAFTMASGTDSVELFIRLRNGAIHYIDAAMYFEGSIPAEFNPGSLSRSYWEGPNYEIRIGTDNTDLLTVTPIALSSAAQTSITDYGEQEERVSSSAVVDYPSALAYAVGVLNNRAIPKLQQPLVIHDPKTLVTVDGLVKLINLPSPPSPAFPSRIRTKFDADGYATQEIELSNERPEFADLLKLTEERAKQGIVVDVA